MNRDGAAPSAQVSAATSPVSDSVSHSRDQSIPSTADRSTGVTQGSESMGLGIWAPALDGDAQALDGKLQAHDTNVALNQDKGVSLSSTAYLQAQVRADVGAGQSVSRTLLIEAADPTTHMDSITGLSRSFGPVHAASQLGPGRFRVTFVDARDSSRARTALSQFANVTEEQDGHQGQDHDVTGFVLATKHVEEGESVTIDSIRSMLTVFGSVASSRSIPMPTPGGSPTSAPLPSMTVALFEFYSIHDAAAAVEAIGSRARSSFSLYLVASDGALLSPADPRFPARLTVRSSSAGESSIPSFSSDRAGSTSAALAAMSHPAAAAGALPEDAQEHPPLPHSHSLPDSNAFAQIPFPTFSGAPRSYPQPPMQQAYSSQPWLPSAPPHMQPPLPGPLNMPPGARGMQAAPRPGRQADFLTTFDPNEAAVGGPRARTTVMIRNIPCRWSAEDLLSVLAHVIDSSWDLLYMPCKTAEVANAGYAFMNFCSSQDTLRLFNAMHGRQWPHTRSGKICEIRYARIQGRQLLTHLNSGDSLNASAFRGYLAYPSGGSIVVHGPDSSIPPNMPNPMSSHAARGLDPSGFPPRGAQRGSQDPRGWGAGPDVADSGFGGLPMPPGAPPLSGMMHPGGSGNLPSLASLGGSIGAGLNQNPPVTRQFSAPNVGMQPAGRTAGSASPDASGDSAFQLQCMLQALMQTLPQ
eukprot:jgi/Ulvmu1/4296/UM002_0016.1